MSRQTKGDVSGAPSLIVEPTFVDGETDADERDGERPGVRARIGGILREAANWRELGRTPYRFLPVAVLGASGFLQVFDTAVFRLAGPDIVRDLGINLGAVINIQQIAAFFAVFATLGAGWWADRHRRVPFFAIGTLLSGVFAVISSRARSFVTLAAPRVADDTSNVAANVPTFGLLADYYPPESRGKAFAVLGTLTRAAAPVAPVAVGAMIVTIGWRTTTLIFGIPLIALGVASFFLREPVRGYMERKAFGLDDEEAKREDEPQSFGEAMRAVFAVRTLRRLFIANIFAEAGTGLFILFLPFFLADHYQLNAFRRGLVGIGPAILGLIGGYLGGGLVDSFMRRNPARVLTLFGAFYLIGSVGLAGVATAPPLWAVIPFYSVFTFGVALVGPASGAVFSQVIPPTVRTQGLQVLNLAILPGVFIILPAALALSAEHGLGAVLLFGAPLVAIGAAIVASAAGLFSVDMRNAFATAVAAEEWREARRSGRGKLLVCRKVDVAYEGVQVLFNVDFDIDDGEIVALLGTNGAGKSTLLRAISGTQEASGGAIVFDGRDITHMPPNEVAARGVVHMPGGRGVFPGLTVRDNIVLGCWLVDAQQQRAKIHEVFEIFPALRERQDEIAGSLSGGEQQMLSLAQAFLASPRLLMIDELSLGLGPAVVDQLLEIVKEINRRGVTVIIVEQSVNVALRIAERAIFMEKGQVRFVGPTDDLRRRPDILRAVYVRGTAGASTIGLRSEQRRRAEAIEQAPPVLEVDEIVKRFGGVIAVDHVSFSLRENEVLGLIGPNGAGKTTLFDVISGYTPPDEGVVRLAGEDITRLAPEERAARKLIRRFQDARGFPALSVREVILVALDMQHQARNAALNIAQAPTSRRAERRLRITADRLLELLGLEAYRDKLVGELSTGLRRIADLACVLASSPRVLLLDEPSTGIAQAEAEGLAPLLNRVRTETGCSILIIEHSMSLIARVSDRLIALDAGAVLAEGAPEEVLGDERVARSYLGAGART